LGDYGKLSNMSSIVAGIDLGSVTTKALIMGCNGGNKIICYHIIRSGAIYKGAANKVIDESLKMAGLEMKDLECIISTGYGRARASYSSGEVTEITCHALGARQIFPDAHTVIDIGGQDSKVIYLNNNGQIASFLMNDKCAAGTGRFIEVMCAALETKLEEIGELSLKAHREVEVSSLCTVFAESEVISLLAEGCHKADIAAAIHQAIARRIINMVEKNRLKERVVMTGGVAKNIGVVRALEKKLGTSLLIPEEPQIIGALGAALVAAKRVKQAENRMG
jgi:predicted CoA-substrate-specific enzyme activase